MGNGQCSLNRKISAFSIAVLSCAALLGGCAATQWVHPDRPKDTVDTDRLFCETVARSEVVRPQAPPPVVNFTGLAAVIKMMDQAGLDREYEAEVERHVTECLKKKGWRQSGSN